MPTKCLRKIKSNINKRFHEDRYIIDGMNSSNVKETYIVDVSELTK